MKTTTLDDYKKAIRAKYEKEKSGNYSSFLIQPSRAKLRELCWEIFKKNTDKDDLNSFAYFLEFEFSLTSRNKLKEHTDKFRPIENFFKGKTDLADLQAADVAAVLVDFRPRPFLNYSRKREKGEIISEEVLETENEVLQVEEKVREKEGQNENSKPHANNTDKIPLGIIRPTNSVVKKKKWLVYCVFIIVAGMGSLLLLMPDDLFEKKDCMEWKEDHYEAVNCNSEEGKINTKIPMDEHQFKLRKVKPSMARTIFYKKNKSGIWYDKTDNSVEFFDGPGYHPENYKYLKSASEYIIDKYAK